MRKFTASDGKPAMQKMVFYNISKNSLDWNWEGSKDKGKIWDVLWKIHYKRKLNAEG